MNYGYIKDDILALPKEVQNELIKRMCAVDKIVIGKEIELSNLISAMSEEDNLYIAMQYALTDNKYSLISFYDYLEKLKSKGIELYVYDLDREKIGVRDYDVVCNFTANVTLAMKEFEYDLCQQIVSDETNCNNLNN